MIYPNMELVRKSFAIQAENFDSGKMNFSKAEYLDDMVSRLDLKPAFSGLEVAAGTCACGRAIAPYVKTMTCLDATDEMLESGRKKGLENMVFIRGIAEDLPFLDESFDFVLSRLAFHHFADIDKPFYEMKRVLKPHGKLVLIDMIADDEINRATRDEIEKMRDLSHVRNPGEEEIRRLYEKNALSVELWESRDVPVSLDSWLGLTKTPELTKKKIVDFMKNDISGGRKTGFNPYYGPCNRIHFNQKWLMVAGVKDGR